MYTPSLPFQYNTTSFRSPCHTADSCALHGITTDREPSPVNPRAPAAASFVEVGGGGVIEKSTHVGSSRSPAGQTGMLAQNDKKDATNSAMPNGIHANCKTRVRTNVKTDKFVGSCYIQYVSRCVVG